MKSVPAARVFPLLSALAFCALSAAAVPWTAEPAPGGQIAATATLAAGEHFAFPPEFADAAGNPLAATPVAEEGAGPDAVAVRYLLSPPAGTEAVQVTSTVCTDEGMCLLPQTDDLPLPQAAPEPPPLFDATGNPVFLDTQAAANPLVPAGWRVRGTALGERDRADTLAFLDAAPVRPAAPAAGLSRLAAAAAFLLGGFLLNLTPCVLPLLPVQLAFLTGGTRDRKGALLRGLAYALGMTLALGSLGLVAASGGAFFGAWMASGAVRTVLGIFLAAAGLAMLGVWHFDLARFQPRFAGDGALARRGKLAAAFALGAAVAAAGSACIAPAVAAALAFTAAEAAAGHAFAWAWPFLLGVGMAAPWPFLAAGAARLPKPGAWMAAVTRLLGGLILCTGLWFVAGAARGGEKAESAEADLADPRAAEVVSKAAERAAAAGKEVVVRLTASWCGSCRAFERGALADAAVKARLAEGFECVVLSVEHPEAPAAASALAALGIPGLPAMIRLVPATAETAAAGAE
jgi:thiol:disulfide interchange protein